MTENDIPPVVYDCRFCHKELHLNYVGQTVFSQPADLPEIWLDPEESAFCSGRDIVNAVHWPVVVTPKENPVTAPLELVGRIMLRLDLLDPSPDNPRAELGDLTELKAAIKAQGILVALTVVPRGDRYEVVFGNRRYQSAMELELLEVPVEIRHDFADDPKALQAARIAEQMNRLDWTVLDRARAFKAMVDLGLSQRKVADLVGCNQSTVSKNLTLLEAPADAQYWLERGTLTQEEVLEIVGMDDYDRNIVVVAVSAIASGQAQGDVHRVLEHTLARKEREQDLVDKRQELIDAGVPVFDATGVTQDAGRSLARDAKAKPLSELPWVKPADHKEAICRAVVVHAPFDQPKQLPGHPKVEEWCLHPRKHPRPPQAPREPSEPAPARIFLGYTETHIKVSCSDCGELGKIDLQVVGHDHLWTEHGISATS